MTSEDWPGRAGTSRSLPQALSLAGRKFDSSRAGIEPWAAVVGVKIDLAGAHLVGAAHSERPAALPAALILASTQGRRQKLMMGLKQRLAHLLESLIAKMAAKRIGPQCLQRH